MEVNLENCLSLLVFKGVTPLPTPTPPPPTSKTPNIIVTECFVSQQKYLYC